MADAPGLGEKTTGEDAPGLGEKTTGEDAPGLGEKTTGEDAPGLGEDAPGEDMADAPGLDVNICEVSNNPPEVILYEPQQSYVIAFGIDHSVASRSLHTSSTAAKDAEHIVSSFVACEVVPESNVQLVTTLTDHDRCTSGGIRHAFKECAQKVGREGMLVFIYNGSGVKTNDNNCSLYSLDFNEDDANTHITSKTLLQWLAELQNKPKHILFILDCAFAGKIASELTTFTKFECTDVPQELSILTARNGSELAFVINTLDHSIFSYFVSWAFHSTPFTPGLIPMSKMFEKIRTCTSALSSLVVTYDTSTKVLTSNMIDPEMKHLKKRSVYLVDQVRNEDSGNHAANLPVLTVQALAEDGEDMTDAPVGRFEYLTKHFNQSRRSRRARPISLHEKAMVWLEIVKDSPQGPLAQLHANKVLHSEVLLTAFCSMMFSLASTQVAVANKSVSDPNLFIFAFFEVTAAVETINCEAKTTVDYFRHSWQFYHQVLVENHIRDRKLRELLNRVNRENRMVAQN